MIDFFSSKRSVLRMLWVGAGLEAVPVAVCGHESRGKVLKPSGPYCCSSVSRPTVLRVRVLVRVQLLRTRTPRHAPELQYLRDLSISKKYHTGRFEHRTFKVYSYSYETTMFFSASSLDNTDITEDTTDVVLAQPKNMKTIQQ